MSPSNPGTQMGESMRLKEKEKDSTKGVVLSMFLVITATNRCLAPTIFPLGCSRPSGNVKTGRYNQSPRLLLQLGQNRAGCKQAKLFNTFSQSLHI